MGKVIDMNTGFQPENVTVIDYEDGMSDFEFNDLVNNALLYMVNGIMMSSRQDLYGKKMPLEKLMKQVYKEILFQYDYKKKEMSKRQQEIVDKKIVELYHAYIPDCC